jgi:hypothetical protein
MSKTKPVPNLLICVTARNYMYENRASNKKIDRFDINRHVIPPQLLRLKNDP